MSGTKVSAIIDASGRNARAAIIRGGEFSGEISSGLQAIESFAQTLEGACKSAGVEAGEISEFFLCVGPGSILGTRTASAAVSTIAAVNEAAIHVWDSLETAAYVLSSRGAKAPFAVFAPSRKGFVNCALFDGEKMLWERELEASDAGSAGKIADNAYLLDQRKTSEPMLEGMEKIELPLSEIWEAINKNPKLCAPADFPPNAKSLSERTYAKWKAPALI